MKRACANCDFWDKNERVARGVCRRDPPKADSAMLWPATNADDWCGEFEPRMDEDEDEPEGE
jgi:hypothetical protein